MNELIARIAELEETLRAIRRGEVDAVLVNGPAGEQVFTLQGAEHPYRLMVEAIDEGAATLTKDGAVLYANKSFAEIFDVPLEKLIGASLEKFVSNENLEDLRALIHGARESSTRGEIRLKASSERPRTVRLTLSPNPEFGVEAICAVATELTELIETNEALRVTETSLRRLSARLLQLQDEERRRIARDLHDVTGQKLAYLSMSLGRLGQILGSRKPEVNRALEESREAVHKIVDEIRTMSYLLHPPLLDESGLASAVRWYAEGFQKRSGITLSVEIAPNLGRLSSDAETALFRVVQESLTNVHRYSGSPDAQIQILVDSGQVRLEIVDHGQGVEDGAARASIDGVTSLGVGIPGMRERLHQLGGTLEVDFARTGTRVVAVLPLKRVESQPRSDFGSVARRDARSRILIADDHEVMRRGLRGLIESQEEWAVCGEAMEGQEAVQKSRELKPDLVILDINMPRLRGIDAAQQIRRENPLAKILFFSVHESQQAIAEALRAGAQGYVAKSRGGHDLVDAVRMVLSGKTFFPAFSPVARSA